MAEGSPEQNLHHKEPTTSAPDITRGGAWRTVAHALRKLLPGPIPFRPETRALLKTAVLAPIVLATGEACSILESPKAITIDLGDTGKFPTECPANIRAASRAVLDVGIHLGHPDGSGQLMSLSGVLIGPNQVLTSGHGLRDEASGKVWNKLEDGTEIERGAVVGLSDSGEVVKRAVQRSTSDFFAWPNKPNQTRDLALLETEEPITELPYLPISEHPAEIGDPVFCIDYGPDGEDPKRARYPEAPDEAFRRPATYLGVVVGFAKAEIYGEQFPVIMPFRNLGEGDAETKGRRGSSGGAVATQDGTLAGNIRMFNWDTEIDAPTIEGLFNIQLTGLTDTERAAPYQLFIYQPVTRNDVEELSDRIAKLPKSGQERWAAPARGVPPAIKATEPKTSAA